MHYYLFCSLLYLWIKFIFIIIGFDIFFLSFFNQLNPNPFKLNPVYNSTNFFRQSFSCLLQDIIKYRSACYQAVFAARMM